MVKSVSPHGAFVIASHEALVPTRYRDLAGVDTWGIGHTHHAGTPDPRAMAYHMPTNVEGTYREAWDIFQRDLARYTADVVSKFGADLAQHELDGLVGWHFNTGGALSSSAVAKWHAGDKVGAVRVVQSWNKVTVKGQKVVSDALVARRKEEAALILSGAYPKRKLAVYPTDGHGRVIWKPIETFTWDEWSGVVGSKRKVAAQRPAAKPTAKVGKDVATDAGIVAIAGLVLAMIAKFLFGG